MQPDTMNAESLFYQAIELEPQARADFLKSACGSNTALRLRVDALLAAHEQVKGFLPSHSTNGGAVRTVVVQPLSSEQAGTWVDRYKLLEQIGEGGFGTVWAAEQREPVRRRVALKIIKLGMDSKQVVARFEVERQALALMDHPNIARVLDAGATEAGRPYFVMELVKGIPITKYCDQEKLRTEERLELFIKVCQAIQHAHQKGIIHRDIKPSNILITLHDGVPVPKVIDFGIAKATQAELTELTVYTQHHQFIGTPAYMSPEQAEMSGLDIDTRSDIYSLGVLLYELLAGSTPFDAKELMQSGLDEMRQIIREREPLRPSTRLTHLQADSRSQLGLRKSKIQKDLDWIVMKCLEKDRTRRYATANALAMDLKRHMNNEPVVARPPSAMYRLQKAWSRNRIAYTAILAVATALLLGFTVSTWQAIEATQARNHSILAEIAKGEEARRAQLAREQAETEGWRAVSAEREARRRLYAANMNLAFEALRANRLGRTADLLNSSLPRHGEADLRGWEWRYIWRLSRGDELLTLPPHDDRVAALAYASDGTLLASGCWGGSVQLWNTSTHNLVTEYRHAGRISAMAFNSAGDRLAVLSGSYWDGTTNRKISLWSIGQNQPFDQFDLDEWPVWFLDRGSVVFSPDDSMLAIGQSTGEILFRDHSRRTNIVSFQAHAPSRDVTAMGFSNDGRFLASGGRDGMVRIWELRGVTDPPELRHELSLGPWRSDMAVFDLEFDPSGGYLAACGKFGDTGAGLRIWDLRNPHIARDLTNHTAWIAGVAFSQDGRHLFSASADQSVRIWDTDAWEEITFLKGHANEIWDIALSPNGQRIATGGKDRLVKIWDARVRERSPEVTVMSNLKHLVFAANGNSFLTIDQANRCTIWNSDNLEELGRLPTSALEPMPNRAAMAGGFFVTTHATSSIQLVNWRTGQLLDVFPGAQPEIAPVLSQDGHLLAFASTNRHTIRVLELPAGRERPSLDLDRIQIPQMFSPDGRKLLARVGGLDELMLWDLETFEGASIRLTGPEVAEWMAFAPDGRRLAAVGGSGVVSLFLLTDAGSELQWQVNPDLTGLFAVCFSPEGRRVVVISSTGVIWLCDTETGQEVATLQTAEAMWSLARFSSSGDNLLVYVADQLHVYQAASLSEIDRVEPNAP